MICTFCATSKVSSFVCIRCYISILAKQRFLVVQLYIMEYPTSYLYFLGINLNLKASVYTKKRQVTQKRKFPLVYHDRALHNYSILCHGKAGCNNLEYLTAFLKSF